MIDLRPISLVIGILLTTLGAAMIGPVIIDYTTNNEDWKVFATSSVFTLFIGISLLLSNWGRSDNMSTRQAFILTTLSWVSLTAFAAIPFALSELNMSYTDSFFEAMSGLTTTGATVIIGLDYSPQGILLWRAILQWLGGIGIILMALSVLPMLQIGGMQMFKAEAWDASEKILPRATQIAGSITLIYVTLTILNTFAYYLGGMRVFDAVCHAMTTIATGGFSTHDTSLAFYDSRVINSLSIGGMLLGSLPFLLYLKALRGNFKNVFQDSQTQVFLFLVVLFICTAMIYRLLTSDVPWADALEHSAFNVVSVMTGTGYATSAYDNWGSFAIIFFFCIMFVGGCAGSTSCGIKVFRFQVIAKTGFVTLQKLLYPHGVFRPRYNGRPLAENVSVSVMNFIFLFVLFFGLTALVLNLLGLDNLTALSAAATSIANVGPGLGGIIGPSGTFTTLPDSAKWVLSFAMLMGRLELLTILVMFSPAFWRN